MQVVGVTLFDVVFHLCPHTEICFPALPGQMSWLAPLTTAHKHRLMPIETA